MGLFPGLQGWGSEKVTQATGMRHHEKLKTKNQKPKTII
jgi:hypothetical protein